MHEQVGQAGMSMDKWGHGGRQEQAGAGTSTNKQGQVQMRTIKDNQVGTSRDMHEQARMSRSRYWQRQAADEDNQGQSSKDEHG